MTPPRVVVVGGGPTGAAACWELVRRGLDVVLLDAGTQAPRGLLVKAAGNTVVRFRSGDDLRDDRQSPKSRPDNRWYSSLSLGGLSNHWTSAVPRFEATDFEEGAAIDERYRWPVRYDDLVPHYEQAERFLSVTVGREGIPTIPANIGTARRLIPRDWLPVVESMRADGVSIGSIPMAKGAPWMVALRGTEFNSYHAIVAGLLGRPTFRLQPDAFVARLVWSSTDGRVVGVEHHDSAGTRTTTHADAVVLAAGAVDSTMIALRSRSADHPDGIGNSRGLVGRYLHDHPKQWWQARLDRRLSALAHPLYIARDRSAGPLRGTSLTIGLGARVDRLRTYYRGRSDTVGVQVFGTMVPAPSTGIELDGDPAGHPAATRPVLRLGYDTAVETSMTEARTRFVDAFASAGVRAEVVEPVEELAPGTSVHHGGSLRMHDDPRFGVVDGWNRMYDAPNTIVVDSSCFTTGPEKNPVVTAMALSLRAAGRLAIELTDGTAT